MNQVNLKQISDFTVERYSKRYQELGRHIRTLGWGNVEQQHYRFMQTLSYEGDMDECSIVDVGCGFGDYAAFLEEKGICYKQYLGWDINPNFISEANGKYDQQSNKRFEIKDLATEEVTESVADIGVMFGLLNWKLDSKEENLAYSKTMIKNAFAAVNKCLFVDFLSTNLTPEYPEEDAVFYHSPSEMLDFAASLSPNFVLKHNYAPIPQKEFILVIYK